MNTNIYQVFYKITVQKRNLRGPITTSPLIIILFTIPVIVMIGIAFDF